LLRGFGSDDTTVLVTAAAFKTGAYWLIRRGTRRGWFSPGQSDLALGTLGGVQLGAAVYNHDKVRDYESR
jgi:hypothetical protein